MPPKFSLKMHAPTGSVYHQPTGFVMKSAISTEEKKTVVGVLENDAIRPLTDDDVAKIKASEYGLKYELPEEDEQEDEQVVEQVAEQPISEQVAEQQVAEQPVAERPIETPQPPEVLTQSDTLLKVVNQFINQTKQEVQRLETELAQTKLALEEYRSKFENIKKLFA